MTLDRITFSVVVPTYNRPNDLRRCLESVGAQTRPPAEVIVVADGDSEGVTEENLSETLPDDTRLRIMPSDGVPGSSVARNTGVRAAEESVVVILDDDVVLGETYLERLEELYEAYDSEALAGIGGHEPLPRSWIVGKLFDWIFYQGVEGFRINRVGMSRVRSETDHPREVDWLVGNNMSFKRKIIEDHPFPQWHRGREPHEDLAVGWALKLDGYHCVLDPALPIEHHEFTDQGQDSEAWRRAGRNRVRLFRRYGCPRDAPLFAWAALGELLRQLFSILLSDTPRAPWVRATSLFEGYACELVNPSDDPVSRE